MALDSLVQAWSQLSRARSSLLERRSRARTGRPGAGRGERARQLKPKDPSVYLAIGDYYGNVIRLITNSRPQPRRRTPLAPDNVDLLGAVALTR